MRFYLIAGLDAPDDVWLTLTAQINAWGHDAIIKFQGDSYDDALPTDILVGHSIGGHDALHLFNHDVGQACLILDHVSKDWWPWLTLKAPYAERRNCKSLHRIVYWWRLIRSTGVTGANDETLEIGHDEFPSHPRTAQLIYNYINNGQWN